MTINTPGIEEMIQGCKNNDVRSKELMYKTFYGYVMGVVVRYVNKINDAEELVNDCFIKIFKYIEAFESRGSSQDEYYKSFKGWIAKIASRTAIDQLRKDKKNFVTDALDKTEYRITPVQVSHNIDIKDILRLLDKLPQAHRLVFNLYEIEGFSHDEISKILKIPASSSRVFLTRAKNKLRELYVQIFNQHVGK
ncbi:RNA polymerase [Arachidicoccus ginsenosidimutans]|uniref:RNA polymerase sigma factor n=1 Tax=Arachidicoccus sp. BS20 TaxID=1850526 RepID=UPI0007F083E3|nr:sigma-70 family RNA polymerase sigma factor [Arachidicoccus sp. BS20]ANI87869.1 RNA polymerase [Arachidicoccus sp. BS20]